LPFVFCEVPHPATHNNAASRKYFNLWKELNCRGAGNHCAVPESAARIVHVARAKVEANVSYAMQKRKAPADLRAAHSSRGTGCGSIR
jgi:hypothetical protein